MLDFLGQWKTARQEQPCQHQQAKFVAKLATLARKASRMEESRVRGARVRIMTQVHEQELTGSSHSHATAAWMLPRSYTFET